jgi:probable rRNA maturation factor
MSPRVDFVETSRRWRGDLPARTLARSAITAAVAQTGARFKRGAELTVHLMGDDEIRALNAQWRGKDAPTNVLSFPAAAGDNVEQAMLLGDILIAFETVAREAEAEGKPLADHFRHLVIHGFLHLLGHDHVEPDEAEAMEAIEIAALARLGIADPYAASELLNA